MKIFIFTICIVFSLSGCVSMTPEAAKIMLHSQMSTLLDSCKKLGPVGGEASGWPHSSLEQQAINNMRDNAAKKFGDNVDSVALINTDEYAYKIIVSGIAFKCF